jgi:uptake hydrogenase large subunit
MTPLAGELTIDLITRDAVVSAVQIASTRPQVADRLLAGKPADAAVALVPQLFTICGRAQGLAADLALQAARGQLGADPAQRHARNQRIEMEIAQEYLWRALLDWPTAVGMNADAAVLADLRRALNADPAAADPATRAAVARAAERGVFGGSAQAWFEHEHVPAFEIWIAQGATPAARFVGAVQREGARHGAPRSAAEVPLLPSLAQPQVLAEVAAALAADEAFAREPLFDGRPAETGAVSRHAAHSLVAALLAAFGRSTLTRLAARITELARIAAGIESAAPLYGALTLAAGAGVRRGLGWVETARGVLVHLIDLDGVGADERGGRERIARYRILAPTEWNFHPRGAVAAGLLGVHAPSADELRQRADWLVQSLDPCVEYVLRIDGAGRA